jgi:hypothetical protein
MDDREAALAAFALLGEDLRRDLGAIVGVRDARRDHASEHQRDIAA